MNLNSRMRWNPKQYLEFSGHRLRPALDLINQMPAESPARVYDLGCGPGNITRMLAERWPGASVCGIDSSPDMLARACEEPSTVDWRESDINSWTAEFPADIIFSNAALQWLDDHKALFGRLLSMLNPGGVLAVQMPKNFTAPSHLLRDAVAGSGPWADMLAPLYRQAPILSPDFYYDLLAPGSASVDIWETEYTHILEGANPVLDWISGTALKPYLDAFDSAGKANWKEAFLEEYKSRLNEAYPKRMDGRTLFSFRRLFIVIVK